MRKIETLGAILILLISAKSFAQPEPQVGKRWIVVPELTDEFEGTVLNAEKWTTDHNVHPVLIWPGRPPAVFHPDKVKVDSGKVTIEVGKLPQPMQVYKYGRFITYEYYGGCIRGFTPARIGQYYECESKMNRTEMGGGFWMAAPHSCGKVREIDITESVGRITGLTADWARDWDHIFHSNGWYTQPDCSETKQTSNKINLPTKNHEQFYRYGFWWKSAGELLFYLNGEYTYSISLPDDSGRELYLQYDIETYDWNPLPADGGKVANGTLEERTTQLNYIHTFKLVDADDPGYQVQEVFNIYNETLRLENELGMLTTDSILEIPLSYKANEDREIHLELLNDQETPVGKALIPAYAGYSKMVVEFALDSVPSAGTGYTLYADIRPVNSTVSDTIMTDIKSLELRKPSVLTIQVKDEESNNPLPDVSVSLNDTTILTNAEGLAVFQNISVTEYNLELTKEGYATVENEKLQILSDTLIIKHLSPELFNLTLSFVDYNSSSPIKNAEVSIDEISENTGASGKVLFSLQKGIYELLLEHSNYLFRDSVTVSQHSIDLFRLKKTFSDFYVTVKKDNKTFANAEVTMGDTTLTSDARGNITFPLLKIDSTYTYWVIEDSVVLKEDSVLITENGLLTINISSLSSSSEPADFQKIVYPNPAKEVLYVPGTGMDARFNVYNVSGVKVMSGRTSNNSISVKNLPRGVYFLGIEEKTITRFVVE